MMTPGAGDSPGPVPTARPAGSATATRPAGGRLGPLMEATVTVLALDGLRLAELRALRRGAQAEEADLSYVRRLLQGRIDIIRAELARRAAPRVPVPVAEAPRTVVDRLSEILTDGPTRHRSSARHVTLGAPRSGPYRQLAEEMLAEVELSDLRARTSEELELAIGRLTAYEQQVSGRRQQLQRTSDDCGAEITRRYREGEAQVDDLLP
ncbi:ABC transporter substrate-binding protein [Streptomyces sp. HSW2009]|uniref:RsiG family protein n=1 Tax=Streptomyces sp. HSW2009 TaxID=3142890 RepID=UPI0032ED4D7B